MSSSTSAWSATGRRSTRLTPTSHLAGLTGPVLDLGCGPGQWTSYLHSLGADVSGVDMVPEFISHARATHAGLDIRQGSMTELDFPDHFAAGILS